MKVLVAVKSVVDANIKVKLNPDGKLDVSGLKKALNPFDEIAVEEAVQLKEKGKASEVVVVTIGVPKAADVLRVSLAMGADRAILLETDKIFDALTVSKLISKVMEEEKPGLVLCGKQAIDNDSSQIPQMIAALNDMPQATQASKLEVTADQTFKVTREVDGGLEELELTAPAVVSADLRLNAPRYVTLPMMMKSKKKPIKTIKAEDFGIPLEPHIERIDVEAPPARKTGVMLKSVDELIDRLKNEAKVLK